LRKRGTIISLAVLISVVALLGYFFHQGKKSLSTDPYKVVSPEACIVVETIDIQSLINSVTTGKGLFSGLAGIKEFENINLKLKSFADQLNNPGFKKFLQGGTSLIAFFPSESGKLIPLLSVAVPVEMGVRQMKEALQSSGVKTITEKRVSGRRLFLFPFITTNTNDTVFLEINSGLIVCSTSEEIVRKALVQKNLGTDIRSSPGFSRVLLSSGKNEDKLFIVFGNLKGAIDKLFVRGSSSPDKIIKLGETAGGDIFINDDGIAFSGYTESNDSSGPLSDFKKIPPGEFHTYKVLPAATALFESRMADWTKPLKKTGSGAANGMNDLAARLKPFMGEEITKAYLDIKENPAERNSIIVYELRNRVQCENIFLEGLSRQLSVGYFQPDDQTKIPVYYTVVTGLASALNPGVTPKFADSYYTFFDNYMITGNSYVTLSRFLYDNLLNKTLANDLQYREFEKSLQSRAGYLFYCVPPRITDYLEGYLSSDIIRILRTNKTSVSKIQSVGFQLAAINGMLYDNLSVRYREEVIEESATEWETLLDTTAAIKPFFFTNHITGGKEIFIQDLKNNAYLINSAGRVLWKVPLKERITSTVYMIDYYRNGKYQLLFSGRNNLHLLDRNGNYVERYPVRLRSPSTNSLAMFDYDNNGNYRLVIAGEDKMIYSYEKNGSVVKGWKPPRTAGVVASEIVYYRVSGKDFIIAADESSLYFLDRYGNIRLKLKDAVTKARNSTIRLAPGSGSYLVCSAPDGTVQNIYLDGSVTKFSLGTFSGDHCFDFFDVDGDGFGEYIFIDKGILYLYDNDRKEMFRREFNSDELGGPINFVFSTADRKIGVFDVTRNLIYLIDSKGSIMDGFPLRGASMFSIGKLSSNNDFHLIVGGTDRFLYNYRLNTLNK
jgi:hypothetical protein